MGNNRLRQLDPYAVVWNSVEGKYVHQTGVLGGAVVGQGGGDQSVPAAGELVHAAPAQGNSGSVKERKFSRKIQSRVKSCAIFYVVSASASKSIESRICGPAVHICPSNHLRHQYSIYQYHFIS